MAGPNLGYQLANPPADGISNLRFSANSDLLLASSWDGSVRLYDPDANQIHCTLVHRAPVLDATFQDDSTIFSAGLDGQVKRFDVTSTAETVVGSHEQPVRCVEWLGERGMLASGSWDSTLRVWDPRAPPGSNCVAHTTLPGKVFSMAQGGQRLVVATSQRQILIYDIRRIESGQPEQQRESSLKFQTRCVRCFTDGLGFAISSVEGRVAMEFFADDEAAQAKKFAFKCHRRQEDGVDTAYPVNAMAFNPEYGTFATGGCDGVVSIWDGDNKKRLFQIAQYPTSVAALAFDRGGTQLAVASSYTHEQGERDHPPDAIYVRRMLESEVKPKPRR